jgi:hypothetical protein
MRRKGEEEKEIKLFNFCLYQFNMIESISFVSLILRFCVIVIYIRTKKRLHKVKQIVDFSQFRILAWFHADEVIETMWIR